MRCDMMPRLSWRWLDENKFRGCCSTPGGGALGGMVMCHSHDLFSGQSAFPSLPIFHQCATHVPPPFSNFRNICIFSFVFGQNFSSQEAKFQNFPSHDPSFSQPMWHIPTKKVECPPPGSTVHCFKIKIKGMGVNCGNKAGLAQYEYYRLLGGGGGGEGDKEGEFSLGWSCSHNANETLGSHIFVTKYNNCITINLTQQWKFERVVGKLWLWLQ